MTGLLQTKHREDIQALRGFAVLVVVLYHAKLSWISAGYLGVDVFFVISGFLITKLVKEKIELGNFSFKEFYMRRAMRLLPAAYVTFAATGVLAGFLLSSTALESFKMQMVGALTFTDNMVLWGQSGYFASADSYQRSFHSMRQSLAQAGVLAPIWLVGASKCGFDPQWHSGNPVAQAHSLLNQSPDHVRMAISTDAVFEAKDRRADGCHLSQSGQQKLAHTLAQAVLNHRAPSLREKRKP